MTDDTVEKRFAALEAKTGVGRSEWVRRASEAGSDRHADIIDHLKAAHGLTHGHANLVALAARGQIAAEQDESDVIAAQYAGREDLRPIYEAVRAAAEALGPDVEVAPKKGSVSFRRARQFALVEPKSKTRVELGLQLKGREPVGRLEAAKGMTSHKVSLTSPGEVDDEVAGWLAAAYEAAG